VLAGRDCRCLGLEERWFAVVGVLEVVVGVGVGVGLWVRFPGVEKEHQGRIRNKITVACIESTHETYPFFHQLLIRSSRLNRGTLYYQDP